MRIRSAAVAALALASVAAVPATAKPKPAPKPLCNLVSDPGNDTFLLRYQDSYNEDGAPYGPQEDRLDLLGADFGSNAKFLTAAIRVKSVAAAPQTSPGGVEYDVNFTSPFNDDPLYLRAIFPADGSAPTYEFGSRKNVVVTTVATKIADATGVVDTKKNEVHITVPVSAFATVGGLKPGTKLGFGEVTAGRYAAGRAVFADVVVGDKYYPHLAPSCVAPNK